jgi:hypothetical protein
MDAFLYPREPHVRRHGPRGYASAESFRSWLRDEFSFRCVCCLVREQWGLVKAIFGVDHFHPVASHPTKASDYDNLLYCCATCNAAKGKLRLPSPERHLIGDNVVVDEDGRISGNAPEARRLISLLGLNGAEYTEFRSIWLSIIALTKQHDTELYNKLMGYPDNLPNLATLRPPGGNSRPDGIERSCLAQQKQGKLPVTY